MDKQEVSRNEFFDKYKDVEFKFSSYYKFTFTYRGFTEDGEEVTVSVGGNADDIYREQVEANVVEYIYDLCPYEGESDTMCFYDY